MKKDVDFESVICYNPLFAQLRLLVKACAQLRLPRSPTTGTKNQHQLTLKFQRVWFVFNGHITEHQGHQKSKVHACTECQTMVVRFCTHGR